jgi:hypothetical protein
MLVLSGATIGLAWLSWRLVETPFRTMNLSIRRLLVSALVAIACGLGVGGLLAEVDRYAIRKTARLGEQVDLKPGEALDFGCEYERNTFSLKEGCKRGEGARVLIWGDSFAKQLVGGLTQLNIPFVEATKSGCPPVLHRSPYSIRHDEYGAGKSWSRDCLEFNQSVYDHLRSSPGYKVVVLASPFNTYSDGDQYLEGGQVLHPAFFDRAQGLASTLADIQKLGISVFLAYPPPSTGESPTDCLLRKSLGRTLAFRTLTEDCSISKFHYQASQAEILKLLDAAVAAAHVYTLDYAAALCDAAVCRASINGVPLYRDSGHIRFVASELLAKHTHFFDALVREVQVD